MTTSPYPAIPLHVVRPDSVGSWFQHFVRPAERDLILAAAESRPVEPELIVGALRHRRADLAVLHSSHDTLLTDRQVAAAVRAAGHRVVVQSATAAALGTDKFLMKDFFDRHGIPSLPWVRGDRLGPVEGNPLLVIKVRGGTQSRGTVLARLRDRPPRVDEFGEHYHDGVEYSVVVFRDPDTDRVLTLPPIWKGPTSTALVPPWRRLRLCPFPALDPRLDHELRELSRSIAIAADCVGLVEVEFLVTEDQTVQVLEINPRLSGTMRLAAMATGVPIFSLYTATTRADLTATGYAAEIPHQGPPISDPARGVFATSRLTVVAADPDEMLHKLHRNGGGEWVADRVLVGATARPLPREGATL